MSPLSVGSSVGRAAGEVMLLPPSQGLLNLPGAQRSASMAALQEHFPCPVNFSAPRGRSGLCKISRQESERAAAVHLPGHCQILDITLASSQDGSGTEKKRNGRGNVVKWPSNSCLLYNTISPTLLIDDNYIIDHILSSISQI